MSATITDYFNKAGNMNGDYPPVATVSAARSAGGSVLTCDSLSGWATDTPVHFSTFKVNTDGSVDASSQTDWKGIVVNNTITQMTRLAGAEDSGNASGDRVELNPTIGWLDDLITGILVSHKQNGALKDGVVGENALATGAVTSTKLAAGAVSSSDKIADDVIQARNLVPGIRNYSLEEQDTGFTWVDGKKIYKKTIDFGALPNASEKGVAHGVTGLSNVLRIEGCTFNGTGDAPGIYHFPISLSGSFNGANNATSIRPYVHNGQVIIATGMDRTAYRAYITLYYTKTG